MRLAGEHSRRAATGHETGDFLKAAFWHDRWKNDQIGFHNEEINERLTRHWPTLGIDEGAKVFVPLCGKSLDMRWLRQQGHPVLGVDLSPIAIHAFFSEAGITPSEESEDSSGALTRSSAEGFELFGDSFEVETLWSSGWIDAPQRFRDRGLKERCDTVLRLDRGGRS